MLEIELSSELDSLLGTPSSSSDSSKNLGQVQLSADAQRQQDLLMARNNQIRSKLESLRKRVDNDDKNKPVQDIVDVDEKLRSEIEILRQELQQLRSQTDQDREQIAISQDNESNDVVSREIELQAALQAERQQASLMRKALEERDKALEELTNQCQSLEDDLEDREREMDHLTRKIEQVEQVTPPKSESLDIINDRNSSIPGSGSIRSAGRHTSEIIDLFEPPPVKRRKFFSLPWAIIGKSIGIVAGIGFIGIIGILAWPQMKKFLQSMPKPKITDAVPPTLAPPVPQLLPKTVKPVQPPVAVESSPINVVTLQKVHDRLQSGGTGPIMVQLPAGKFFMGSKPLLGGSIEREEQPYHEVVVKTFFMASFETSFEEYDQFCRANQRALPDDTGFGRGTRPVINVSWQDAQAYAQWLSSETGFHYYLPSEAQWEYAARGGTISRYWWGNTVQQGRAVCFACGTAWDGRSTAPVGSLTPNAFGLYDMSGNVMEWLQDCYNSNYYDAPANDSPWLDGDCSLRIVRGGAFNKPITMTRSSARFRLPVENRFDMVGFRVARD